MCAERSRSRKGLTLAMAVVVLAAMFVVAGAARFHVSAHRRGAETLHAQRLLRLIASSAFEEASDAVEAANQQLPALDLPRAGTSARPRDLKTLLNLPAQAASSATQALYLDEGATVSAVRLVSSDWAVDAGAVTPTDTGVQVQVREIGVLSMEVVVTIRRGSVDCSRTVRTRRFCQAAPRAPGGPVSVMVHAEDLSLDSSRNI